LDWIGLDWIGLYCIDTHEIHAYLQNTFFFLDSETVKTSEPSTAPTETELQEINSRLLEIPSRIHRATNAGDLDLLRTVSTRERSRVL
jgi:hypothetical protein